LLTYPITAVGLLHAPLSIPKYCLIIGRMSRFEGYRLQRTLFYYNVLHSKKSLKAVDNNVTRSHKLNAIIHRIL